MEQHAEPVTVCRICGLRPTWTENTLVCVVCFGFDKDDGEMSMSQPAQGFQSVSTQRNMKDATCKTCGKTPEETKFYPSRKDRCAACIIKTTAENRTKSNIPRQAPLNPPPVDPAILAEIDAQPDVPSLPTPDVTVISEPEGHAEPKGPEISSAICLQCGSRFDPYLNGSVKVRNRCHSCLKANIRQTQQRAVQDKPFLTLDFANEPIVLEALAQSAKHGRRTLDAQAIFLLEKALGLA